MPAISTPSANGLRILYDKAQAAGGQFVDGCLHLPPTVGTSFIKMVPIEPGFMVGIHRYCLEKEIALERFAEEDEPERLLFSFQSFDPALTAAGHLSTAQLASTSITYRTVMPAHTPIFTVVVVVEKALLARWLGSSAAVPMGLLAHQQPHLVEALLTPEIQAALQEVTALRPAHELDLLFYRIKVQEMLYGLLRELSRRAAGQVRPVHSADAGRIFQVRTALLTSLAHPPSLARLAQTVGLSETKLKQLFQQVFGTSPYAYYQAARLQEARRLLARWSVSEVGHQLGFTNLGHFAQLFKRQYGLTPKRYQAAQRVEGAL